MAIVRTFVASEFQDIECLRYNMRSPTFAKLLPVLDKFQRMYFKKGSSLDPFFYYCIKINYDKNQFSFVGDSVELYRVCVWCL